MQIPNNSITTPITPVVSNTSNRANEEVLTVQQNPNTSPDIQAGLAEAEGNLLVTEDVPQRNQDALDDAALAIAMDEEVDDRARMQAAESINDQNKKKEAYLKILLNHLNNYSDQSVINILCDIRRVENPETTNALLIEICARGNWPDWLNKIDVDSTLQFFLSLYNMVRAGERQEDTRRQLIKAIVNNSESSKEFREQVVKKIITDPSEKETLLTSIEQGISLQGSNIKGNKSSTKRAQ